MAADNKKHCLRAIFGVVFRAYTKIPRVLDATETTAHFSQRQIMVNAIR